MFKTDDTIKLDKATYRVIELLGSGGQAQVWQVAREDGERFALKVACPFESRSGRKAPRDKRAIDDIAQRGEMEIAFLKELPDAQAHHVLPCLDSGAVIWQNIRLPALLAPLMHEELSRYCPNLSHKPKPFSLEKALTWLRQIAHALAYIHGLHSEKHLYIHRDIKPSNILLDAAGNAFLSDFGILKAARHIGTNSLAYSYGYCAPEQRLAQFLLDRAGQLENQYYLTPATDLYALGVVVYSLFAGGTAAQERLAEESTVNKHLRNLQVRVAAPNPAAPVGLLGEVGGLTKTEAEKLQRVLMDLQGHHGLSAGGTVIDPGPAAVLPNPAWLADRIVELVEKLLTAWPNHRPSASAVLTSVIDLQAALSPCLQRIAFSGETHFQSEQEIVLHLEFAGEGLVPDLNWIEVEFQGKVLDSLHPELIGQAKDTGVLAANICHPARLTLPARAQGVYPVQIIARVGGPIHRAACEVEVCHSAAQLWRQGEHQKALRKELRVAWLEKLYQGLDSTTAAYRHLQLLESLKAQHPKQEKLLDSYKERVERGWQGSASKRRSIRRLFNKGSTIGLSLLVLMFLTVASGYIIKNLPPPRSSAEEELQEARALLEGIDSEMVAIKGGCFLMGSPLTEAERGTDEQQYKVCVENFEIGKYEVTQAQWKAVMGDNPSRFEGDDLPVEQVSWNDVQKFIEKLNAKTAKTYRLPTEAQWEYAARAGTTTPFYTGNCIHTGQANYYGKSDYHNCGAKTGEFKGTTVAVGSYPANPWGLYDMAGNVWEWTCSIYAGIYDYSKSQAVCADNNDANSPRVARGGSWYNFPRGLRSADRFRYTPEKRFGDLGLRLSRM